MGICRCGSVSLTVCRQRTAAAPRADHKISNGDATPPMLRHATDPATGHERLSELPRPRAHPPGPPRSVPHLLAATPRRPPPARPHPARGSGAPADQLPDGSAAPARCAPLRLIAIVSTPRAVIAASNARRAPPCIPKFRRKPGDPSRRAASRVDNVRRPLDRLES